MPSGMSSPTMNSRYASSSTTMTSLGTLSRKSTSSVVVTTWPVGLLGLQTKITRVRSVIAASIASRSWRSSASSGTWTLVAPEICVQMGYASKLRQA